MTLDSNQPLPDQWGQGSHLKLKALCPCGRLFFPIFKNLARGGSNSCGKCEFKASSYWLKQSWGKLKLLPDDLPSEFPPYSGRSFRLICLCGNTTTQKMCDLSLGKVVSCGHCNDRTKEYWLSQRWGKYSLLSNQPLPLVLNLMSPKKFLFKCDCGRIRSLSGSWLVSGNINSCGSCDWMPRTWWMDQKWGSLRLEKNQDLPEEWGKGHKGKFSFSCDCGRKKPIVFNEVASDRTTTCRRCGFKSKEHWLSQKWGRLKVDPEKELPKEWCPNRPTWLLCDCGKAVKDKLFNVLYGKVKSCGCALVGRSENSPAHEVYKFVLSLSPDTQESIWSAPCAIGGKEYDIYIPSKKLAIEYHGLYWHSEEYKKEESHLSKLRFAQERGDRLIQIFSDEWDKKRPVMEEMLSFLISPYKGKRVRPVYSIETSTSSEVRAFLNKHHYLGAASGCLTAIARHEEVIIGASVFMKREEGTVLWHRACWDHRYRAWEPHGRMLSTAIPELKKMGFKRIVTFSDNRFHTGNLYLSLGFTLEKEIPPDYGYTNGMVRKSKYALRVPAGVDEKEAAAAAGWHRIWDAGKRRFSFPLV